MTSTMSSSGTNKNVQEATTFTVTKNSEHYDRDKNGHHTENPSSRNDRHFFKLIYTDDHFIHINDDIAERLAKHLPYKRLMKKMGKKRIKNSRNSDGESITNYSISVDPIASTKSGELEGQDDDDSRYFQKLNGRHQSSSIPKDIDKANDLNDNADEGNGDVILQQQLVEAFKGVYVKVSGFCSRGNLILYMFRIYRPIDDNVKDGSDSIRSTSPNDGRRRRSHQSDIWNHSSSRNCRAHGYCRDSRHVRQVKSEYPGLKFYFQRTISVDMLLFTLIKIKKRYPSLMVPDCNDILNTDILSTENGLTVAGQELEKRFNLFLHQPYSEDVKELPYLMFGRPEAHALVPKVNILILLIGSRGDVQPFIALAKELQKLGHRIRIATHQIFQDFVRNEGIEFFPIGGDPVELMAYMVKNPGLLPKDVREIPKKKQIMKEILWSSWPACFEPDPVSGRPFLPGVMVANPVCLAHIHLAERLQIPLHLFFTMPWSPTEEFSHPFTLFAKDPNPYQSYISYFLVDKLLWLGLHGVINDFRSHCLGLLPIRESEDADSLVHTLQVPVTYCWSSALIPKPRDWGSHIDVSGFFFLDSLSADYQPPPDLASFLEKGPTPIYVGFGSIVVDDIDSIYDKIFDAMRITGTRALVNTGWSGDKSKQDRPPNPNILFLGSCPHDWLFPRCAAVCHHGGAGTLAAGLKAGCPTIVVPFFGDQFFWGGVVSRSGVGPNPIEPKHLTVEKFVEAIRFCLNPTVQDRAKKMSIAIKKENGLGEAVVSFARQLPLDSMQCQICLHAYELANLIEDGETAISEITQSLHPKLESALVAAAKHPLLTQIFLATVRHNAYQINLCALCHSLLFCYATPPGISQGPKHPTNDIGQCREYACVDWTWRRKTHGVTGLTTGIARGCRTYHQSLLDGFHSFRTMPKRGWAVGGFCGCAVGVLLGIGALVVKPLEGTFFLVSDTVVGLGKSICKIGSCCRKKHPRYPKDELPPKRTANAQDPFDLFAELSNEDQDIYREIINGVLQDLVELKSGIGKMKTVRTTLKNKNQRCCPMGNTKGGATTGARCPKLLFNSQDPRSHVNPYPLLVSTS